VAGTEDVVQDGEEDGAADGEDAPVHFCDRRIHRGRPEAEEDNNSNINDRIAVNNGTQEAGASEWAPDELRAGRVDNFVVAVIVQGDVAADPTDKE